MATVNLGSKAIGSIVKLKVNDTLLDFIVVHKGKPSAAYDASCDGVWLLMEDIYENRQWHSSNVNDYAASTIHSYLNSSCLNLFDKDIQAQIKQVKLPYRPGSGYGTSVNSGANGLTAKVFLLSGTEVSMAHSYIPVLGAELDYFKGCADTAADSKRVAKLNGSASYWWLRCPYCDSSSGAADARLLDTSGGRSVSNCYRSYGIRPALILPSSLLVSDDGSVNTNTAPTMPENITIPESVEGGKNIEVTWTASTDAENNLEGYIVERSTDGGSSWHQVYQGGSLSTTNSVTLGTVSVMYRVKAYDGDGLQSGWKTSAQVTVINNAAPDAPDGISVPTAINAGISFAVTWGQAYDSDGSISGYVLERQLDGGAWTTCCQGTTLTYTDTIAKGSNTVAYRVRAYDNDGAFSGYTVSGTYPINNNTAPTISGQDTALGLKTGSFFVNYSVSDAESNPVTVMEAIDGKQLRSHQPALGAEQTVTVSRDVWLTLSNGNHRLVVEASDGILSVQRVWTFSKRETTICFHLSAPRETDEAVKKILVSPTWDVAGAVVKVEACNNAFDDTPAWENITSMVQLGRAYNFLNDAKTADKWGLDIRFTLEKNKDYEGEVSISGFGYAYE